MPGKTDRPYLQHSIAQLEAIFEQTRAKPSALRILERELSFRSTDRAYRLRVKVLDELRSQRPPDVRGTDGRQSAAEFSQPSHGSNPSPPLRPPPEMGRRSPGEDAAKPEAILAAWTALEALSPQTYRRPEDLAGGDRRSVAEFHDGPLPWSFAEASRPRFVLYYQVVLGAIKIDEGTAQLIKVFGEHEEVIQRSRERAAMAVLVVDKKGVVLEDNGIAVSSFTWALPLALQRKLRELAAWPRIEPTILAELERIVRRCDADGQILPLNPETISAAHRWLVEYCGLPAEVVEPPSFVLRDYVYYKSNAPPAPLLLNSFYFDDLLKATALFARNEAPAGLRRYLGREVPAQPIDLLADLASLERAVAPAKFPSARWPGPGGHPLVVLQQAAVNLARSLLGKSEGIFAVNGPPGTGKTTLLRDLVTGCVEDRARSMANFDDPALAFAASGEKHSAGNSWFVHLYRLDVSLKGHEVIVASTNNKAVENISKELPATRAVGRPVAGLRYFKSISDLLYGSDTWGLIAAVLGNAKNRKEFRQAFWWDDENSFRLYLKAAKGDDLLRERRDPVTGSLLGRHMPAIVANEEPPNPQQAKGNWRKARERFLAIDNEIRRELEQLEALRAVCLELPAIRLEERSAAAALENLAERQVHVAGALAQCQSQWETAQLSWENTGAQVDRHRRSRPGLWWRVWRTQRWRDWAKNHAQLVAAAAEASRLLADISTRLAETTKAHVKQASELQISEARLANLRFQIARLVKQIEDGRARLGERLLDEDFFTRSHESWNLTAPWVPDNLHRKREDLFIAALAVHRAFIDMAAQKILHNLSVLMDVFSSGAPQEPAKRLLLGDLWSTLFLVLPVVSTTFASVGRMFADAPPASFGWLLIDEAGQAVPQAAVGAILRSRRTIVVGDPSQIQPVVSLPERLCSEVCKFFELPPTRWAAPEASAQTLADEATDFQTLFSSDRGPRRVGIPLLVHRRCREPMFSIFNGIAYDRQMVLAPELRSALAERAILGPSAWLDVDGEADSKWCPAEGEIVVELLRKLASEEGRVPDLFIISPFRIVAHELRTRLLREQLLFDQLGIDPRQWIENRVGTVHTVQGREAEIVFLVLGAPNSAQNGARAWAAGRPNILNVALSRARNYFYVVGSRGAWSEIGYFRELRCLPYSRQEWRPQSPPSA